MYFLIRPEVAGGLGGQTEWDRTTAPHTVKRLHYEFDGWLGDEVVATFPCFMVTARVRQMIEEIGASGVRFGEAQTSKSELFEELHPDRAIPLFWRLYAVGVAGEDDFGLADGQLVLSARMFAELRGVLGHAEVEPFVT